LSKIQSADPSGSESYAYSFAFALHAAKSNQRNVLLRLLEMGNDAKLLQQGDGVLDGTLDALHEAHFSFSSTKLLPLYDRSPQALADTIAESARTRDAARLRDFLKKREWRPEMRGIVLGLLNVGGVQDVRFVLELIGAAEGKVNFWNAPILASAMTKRADYSLKPWLVKLTESPEFWEYLKTRPSIPLPVAERENLYLFKRISGVVLAALCDKSDWQLLKRLVFHSYWSIQVAAAEKISTFVTSLQLDEILAEARNKATNSPDDGVIYALNLLDQKLYSSRSALLGRRNQYIHSRT
jgi:hypothetical protein